MTGGLFGYVERLQAGREWGAFLDAGTGVNSSLWGVGLDTRAWCAVTASPAHAQQVRGAVGPRLRAQDRLMVGDWTDPSLLAGEAFDTVLADYLVGAVEGFAPYFQAALFHRLRPLTRGRLYVVGLDPYVVGPAATEAARMVREIGRLRDAVLLLADETPYREYPAEWVVNALHVAGFRVASGRRFANRYQEKWVRGQLDMTSRRLALLPDQAMARALAARVEDTRGRALELCANLGGLSHGYDYVIGAEPVI